MTVMEEMKKKGIECFEHPFITMINTLKNNGYRKLSPTSLRWEHEASGVIFDTALDAYIDYLESINEEN